MERADQAPDKVAKKAAGNGHFKIMESVCGTPVNVAQQVEEEAEKEVKRN
jgi:hypothetical protein